MTTTVRVRAGDLSAGLTRDPLTGVIGGIPITEGAFFFTVTAVNDRGSTSVTREGLVRPAEVNGLGHARARLTLTR